jgi:tRNA threonylcarbamoyladenosine biosynthesis protein TsaB
MTVYEKQIQKLIRVDYSFAPAHLNKQRAASIGTLAKKYVEAGMVETAADHKPDYLRLSQAERERLEMQGKNND